MTVSQVAHALRSGHIAVFPTDTVYGIGCVATDKDAVKKLVATRGRETGKPLIVLLASEEDVTRVAATVSATARTLMRAFWPGPLTIVLPARHDLSPEITAGTGTVAVRVPGNAITRELITTIGAPIAAPSANRPGEQPALSAVEAATRFPGIPILDGGIAESTVTSTVVTLDPLRIVREGRIAKADIESALR